MTPDELEDEDEARKEAFQKLQASVNDITNFDVSPELNNDDIFLEVQHAEEDEGNINDVTNKPIKQEEDLHRFASSAGSTNMSSKMETIEEEID